MENLIYEIINYYRPNTIYPEQRQNFACIVHGHDVHPSARVYPETKIYKCYACGAYYGPVGLVRAMEGFTSNEEARDFIFKNFGIRLGTDFQPVENELLQAYRNEIIKLTIKYRHPRFNKIYYELDQAYRKKDEDKLKWIFEGLKKYGQTKNS